MNNISAPAFKPLTITPFGGGPTTLASLDDVAEWLNAQVNGWQQFHSHVNQIESLREHQRLLVNASQAVSRAKNEHSEESIGVLISALRKLESPPYLDAGGVAAACILDALKKRSPRTAYVIYWLWTDQTAPQALHQGSLDIVLLLKAGALWGADDRGLSTATAQLKKEISAKLGKWERELKSIADDAKAMLEKADREFSSAVIRQTEIAVSLDDLRTKSSESLDKLRDDHDAALSRLNSKYDEELEALYVERNGNLLHLEETYTEHLRVKAPADYWIEKARKHQTASRRWLVSLIALIVVGLGALSVSYIMYLYDWIEHFSKQNAGAAVAVLLGLPALLFLTLVRVAHKSYRDEVRHAVDAEQRTTLVRTYLALTEGNDASVQSGERLLALHALFRGSAQSDGPDDTPPVNTLEAIIQSLKPKG